MNSFNYRPTIWVSLGSVIYFFLSIPIYTWAVKFNGADPIRITWFASFINFTLTGFYLALFVLMFKKNRIEYPRRPLQGWEVLLSLGLYFGVPFIFDSIYGGVFNPFRNGVYDSMPFLFNLLSAPVFMAFTVFGTFAHLYLLGYTKVKIQA